MKKNIKTLLLGVCFSLLTGYTAHAATYNVVSGDSLYKLSGLFNTNTSTIMRANGLTNSEIYPGQKLVVPSDTYTVQSGDSLYLIAKQYGLSIYSLQRANNQWTNSIYPGQKIILPGIINGITQAAPTAGQAVISYTASDLDLLARLVNAEAADQPYSAKVAVAAVVINRVQSSTFPNTLYSVIYQKASGYYQFTPVENGWINKPATADATKAAYEALHGSDPSNGALFYFDDSTTSQWLWSKPVSTTIGRMVFAY